MEYKNSSKRQLRSMSAMVYEYELGDGSKQLELWSYNTPMIVKCGDKIFVNENTYSKTTSMHLSTFERDYRINRFDGEFMTETEMRQICM